jgi:hypothetical protein
MPNGHSGGFDLDIADLKRLITSTPQADVVATVINSPFQLTPATRDELAGLVDRCQREQVYIEEQDDAYYLIHISDAPIIWARIRSDSPLLLPLRERHSHWIHERNSRWKLQESRLARSVSHSSHDVVAEPADSTTRNAQRLALVRGVHTLVYGVMAVSTFVLVYAGLTGSQGWWLWVALVLLGVETVVFAGNRMKCPLTALAVRYGAEKGYAFDTFLPDRVTQHTFRFFGSLMLVGLLLLTLRWVGVLGQ